MSSVERNLEENGGSGQRPEPMSEERNFLVIL